MTIFLSSLEILGEIRSEHNHPSNCIGLLFFCKRLAINTHTMKCKECILYMFALLCLQLLPIKISKHIFKYNHKFLSDRGNCICIHIYVPMARYSLIARTLYNT